MTGEAARELRDLLVDRLVAGGRIRSRPVEEAFRAVPRHLFLPGTETPQAYADQAIPTRWAGDGRPVSSSSQPSIMAVMLEQLGVEAGQRVLEIGAGTGYNAALLAHLTGVTGAVVTVDIDAEVAGSARGRLDAAGLTRVLVACADGASGWAAGAPYDRIIVTASARDLAPAWCDQLGGGGRLVLPLSLRGVQQSVAFGRRGDHLASLSAVPCGFMPLEGALARPGLVRPLGDRPGLFLRVEDDRALDLAALYASLGQPGEVLPTGVAITASELCGGLGLWLALHDHDVGELSAVGAAAGRNLVPAVVTYPGMASTMVLIGRGALAALVRRPGEAGTAVFEAAVRAYGPGGDQHLARRLAGHVREWDACGRPSESGLRIRAFPATRASEESAWSVITMPHTRFLLDW